ncbi:peptidoglycan bridge formation glycyltransferase FemA/FemB family protein [Acaricomes phytoseiuli]|uniref:lipid II:glycine glycyltransferase FemX n=1 Tax=Acaricomes phytoseiuli TaxID=291968 RepID=UPI0003A15F2F|nr:peptidoglycan bridge formation glycyltransferase FemA/FemB family protein [Acaricomes phytoseiuli]MCW1250217.1 peptidoglycan bridge formation glycyltransferase FemA/FemB family protein [Acaricomes phytoseiuli]
MSISLPAPAAFTARFASAEELQDWDELVTANPQGGNLLQSEAFAEAKAGASWFPRYLVLEATQEAGSYRSYNLLLEKRIPVFGRLWYLIKGPDLATADHLPAALDAIRELASQQRPGVFAVKIEPDIVDTPEVQEILRAEGLVKTFNLQPNDSTALLDTTGEQKQLFARFSSRARNAIRRAQREGVDVRQVAPVEANFRIMHELMARTLTDKASIRQLRGFDYYNSFWSGFARRGQGWLYFVYEDDVPVVGAYVVKYGRKGTYKDGGSAGQRTKYGDSHLLQWQAINDLRAQPGSIDEYDFCGTPPAAQLKDPNHSYYGLGLFKTSFAREVTDFVGCWDVPVDSLRYQAWASFGERLTRRLSLRQTGGFFY